MYRLDGHRNQLLRARISEGAQARALAAAENQSLHVTSSSAERSAEEAGDAAEARQDHRDVEPLVCRNRDSGTVRIAENLRLCLEAAALRHVGPCHRLADHVASRHVPAERIEPGDPAIPEPQRG